MTREEYLKIYTDASYARVVNQIFNDHEAQLKALQQPKSCEGCKHHITYITSIGDIESCLIFEKDETLCVRKHRWLDRYEPKEQ